MTKPIMISSHFNGYVLAFFGVILFSAKAVLIKLAYAYQIDYLSLLLLRMAFALPFYVVIAIIHRQKLSESVNTSDWVWLVALGIIGYYLASLFDFMGLVYIKASLERLILFLYPTMVLVFSAIIFKIKVTRNQILAICITYCGLFLAFFKDVQLGEGNLIMGSILIFLSAICYAAYLVGSGWLIPKFGATLFTSYAMIISCISILFHYVFTSEIDLIQYNIEVYWLALALAIFCTVLPSFLVSWAIKSIGASNFSIVGSFGPISTILLAYLFLSENINYLQGIGTLVVIYGVYLATKKL